MKKMKEWTIPEDAWAFILKRNLFPLLKRIITELNQPPRFTGTLIGHHLKYLEGQVIPAAPFDYNRLFDLFDFVLRKKLRRDILKKMSTERALTDIMTANKKTVVLLLYSITRAAICLNCN